MGGKFKFQVQDRDLEYLFWQCEKIIALSEKKPPLGTGRNRTARQPGFIIIGKSWRSIFEVFSF